MNATPAQLRLAADILETGHPWEYRFNKTEHWNKPDTLALGFLATYHEIRPVLATPPDNRPVHNPDGLTAEQVGVGYRLALRWERVEGAGEMWTGTAWLKDHGCEYVKECTFRLSLKTPWPEPADPYAELKAAHAAGKVIQILNAQNRYVDADPTWHSPPEAYRIKPEEPAFQLPPPPPGMRWRREDGWKEGDLPQGYRPLVVGEAFVAGKDGDGYRCFDGSFHWQEWEPSQRDNTHCRTTRPLTFEHAGKTWTYHRPGDPMPCDGKRKVYALFHDLETRGANDPTSLAWGAIVAWRIIGWRYAEPQTKTVPLGPEDVKPFTVIRRKGEAQAWHWRTVSYVDGVKVTCGNRGYGWVELASDYERNESLPLTGKWNPDAWEPCSKTVPV